MTQPRDLPHPPRQLPPANRTFVNRVAEISKFERLLETTDGPKDRAKSFVITGMAGVGKTALAIQFAHRVRDRFPDGQLFVNLHGYDASGQPTSPTGAVIQMLQAFGVEPATIPETLDERLALYRHLAARRRLLILFDNAAAAEQVLPLLPAAPRTLAIITSRRTLAPIAAELNLQLLPFNAVDSMTLIAQLAGKSRVESEPEAAQIIANACGNLPLALAIVGAQLSAHPSRTLADLASQLREEEVKQTISDFDTDLKSVFVASYRALDPGAAKVLQLLGIRPNVSITPQIAVAVANIPTREAVRSLRSLASHSLIEHVSDDTFVAHPLVQVFMRSLASELPIEERAAAEARLSELTRTPREHVFWVTDTPATRDLLKRDVFAQVLADRLAQTHRDEPHVSFLVHIDGPWGSGKTTLLNLLRKHLEVSHVRFTVLTYNAWRNAQIDPPWWPLITSLRDQIIKASPWSHRLMLRLRETIARIRRSGAPYSLTMALFVAIIAVALWQIWPLLHTLQSVAEVAANISAILAAITAVWLLSRVATGILLWNSPGGARLFERSHDDPMNDVAGHFAWLLRRSSRPVVFFLDDLDRCDYPVVKGLLDAVQNLVRDSPIDGDDKHQAPSFVVAADGAWLRRCYELSYDNFRAAVDEPGRPLGYLFLDKLFQLSVPLPAMGVHGQSTYLNDLLRAPISFNDAVQGEIREAQARVSSSTSESELLDVLREVRPEIREAVAVEAVGHLTTPDLTDVTEHSLHPFAALLPTSPRTIKRFLNAYSIARALRTLEGNPVSQEALASWVILRIRWPQLGDLLERNPTIGGKDLGTKPSEGAPEWARQLLASEELQWFLKQAPIRLTPDVIRQCCGTSFAADGGPSRAG